MQWTDDNGETYGANPHSGAGHADAYEYEDNGNARNDMATLHQDPLQDPRWAPDTGETSAPEADRYGTRPNLYVLATDNDDARHNPAVAAWEATHGGTLTLTPPQLDTSSATPAGTEPPKGESASPASGNSSGRSRRRAKEPGRRRRRVLRSAWLLAIPAGGYATLLISAALGGPSLNAPFVPQPDPPHPTTPPASAPDTPPSTQSARSAMPTPAQTNARSTKVQKTSGSTGGSTASATSAAGSVSTAVPTGVASPTSTSAPTATSTAAPTATSTSKGRARGSSHKPVK
ncbi:hypothetical protein ACIP5U_23965 [Streptomyces sp. NPDC088788]|uniref:hypothetical protein n=1 Tax=Streptomyces sp. NPDC088788 TaxID=3365898 RepID=UPI0037F70A5D